LILNPFSIHPVQDRQIGADQKGNVGKAGEFELKTARDVQFMFSAVF
jgi:hypothetical protein